MPVSDSVHGLRALAVDRMAGKRKVGPAMRSGPGFWSEVWYSLRLAWRLLRDPRVSPWLKVLVPALAVGYLLLPVDVAPDFFPLLGQLDDLAVLALVARLLIELSPAAVVSEHERDVRRSAGSAEAPPPSDVVDASYRVIDDD